MAFYDKFPYTNFQELNLDWLTQEVSKVRDNRDASDASAAAALASEKAAKASETAAASSQQAAANSETAAAGSAAESAEYLEQIGTHTAGAVADWLKDNMTPTTPAVDASLTISGAAADAQVTGNKITNLKNIINANLMGIDVQENQYPGAVDWSGAWINSNPSQVGVSDVMFDGYPTVYSSQSWRRYYKEIPVVAGKTYTFEAWIKTAVAGTVAIYITDTAISVSDPATVSPSVVINQNTPANEWQKLSITFTCTASGNITPYVTSRAGAFYIAKYVLVEGAEVFSLKKIAEKVDQSQEHPVRYDDIINEDINLADGTYTANGSATVSGNTATVKASYDGINSNEFIPGKSKLKVVVKSTFNVPILVCKLRYYTDSWKITDLFDLVSGTEKEAIIDVSSYNASRFKVLLQNIGLTDGVTNTITVNSLGIYDYSEFESSEYYDSDFEPMMKKVFDGIDEAKNGNGKIYYCKKDGSGDFTSLVEAIKEATKCMDSVVYVGAGTWDIIDEFGETYMNAVSSNNSTWGLVLKNRVHLIGTAKTVIKAVNNSESTNFENIKTYFSVFNAGENGFTLENINIEDENIRYSVHDDRGGSGPEPYTNKYIRCSMIHKNGKYSDCIGAGLGENQTVEIRGCYFEGDLGQPRLVYWHGNNNSQVTDALGKITVCDNYFAQDGTFMLTKYGQSNTDTVAYVSNNSFGTAPSVNSGSVAPYDNMRIVAWNNEIRS